MKSIQNLFMLICVMLFMQGCCAVLGVGCPEENNTQQTTEDLKQMKKVQEESTNVIDAEAKKAQAQSTEITKEAAKVAALPDPVAKQSAAKIDASSTIIHHSATSILAENEKLKRLISVMEKEKVDKQALIDENKELKKERASLKEKLNSNFRTITFWLYGAGGLLIAISIGAAVYFKAKEALIGVVVGGTMIVIAVGAVWVENNIGYIIGGGIAIALGVGYRIWKLEFDATKEATRVGEMMKDELKKTSPEFLKDLFGEGSRPGRLHQSPVTQAVIERHRKAARREWKATEEKV